MTIHRTHQKHMVAERSLAVSAPLLKLAQVAKALGVSQITVRRRVSDGSLAHVRIKGRLYFRQAELQAFVARHSHASLNADI